MAKGSTHTLADTPNTIPVSEAEEHAPSFAEDPASRFINRELSWLRFNRRVLAEALDERLPLLERVRFLSIFGSNLDEFFMIRVAGLRTQLAHVATERSPDGRTPAEQLAAIRKDLLPTLDQCTVCWQQDLLPRLRAEGIRTLEYTELKSKQRKLLRRHFRETILPVLTPLALDPGHPFPHISNLSINLAVVVRDEAQEEKFARIKVPEILPRLVRIPDEATAEAYQELGLENVDSPNFVWLEDVIAANLDLLLSGIDVVAAYPFRVTRNADLEIEEDEASDLLTVVSNVVERRHFGQAVRLEVDHRMPKEVREILTRNLEVAPYQVYAPMGPLGLSALSQLTSIDRPDLKYPPYVATSRGFGGRQNVFEAIRKHDIVLHHPYDAFDDVLELLAAAARDPDVVAIKQTLYRVGPASPVVRYLKEARENHKQVAVLVELKARFDEENNIVWAQELEDAGVHVVYGVVGLKTHAKMTLVVRRESGRIRLYVHLATGNYNPATGNVYTDMGLLTCDPRVAGEVVDLFNALTGYSAKTDYEELVVAPEGMRLRILALIDREIARHRQHGDGYIAFKCNALSDEQIIDALYRASSEGVRIELQVRGICCLRPQVPGLSDHIRVTSVVGRFLEHTRVYYFRNGGEGQDTLLIGSADLMPRNLDRRVEVLVPIKDGRLRKAIAQDVLEVSLADNVKCWDLCADGSYRRREGAPGEEVLSSQEHFMQRSGAWRLES